MPGPRGTCVRGRLGSVVVEEAGNWMSPHYHQTLLISIVVMDVVYELQITVRATDLVSTPQRLILLRRTQFVAENVFPQEDGHFTVAVCRVSAGNLAQSER